MMPNLIDMTYIWRLGIDRKILTKEMEAAHWWTCPSPLPRMLSFQCQKRKRKNPTEEVKHFFCNETIKQFYDNMKI
jgi:hypothetical protein